MTTFSMISRDLAGVSKKVIIVRIVCFFWLIAKLMSWKLWLAKRLFPLVPAVKFLFVSPSIHLILFILSLGFISMLLLFPKLKLLTVIVILLEVASCMLDQNRWQPWEFQYIFIFLAISVNKKDKDAVSSIAFMLSCIYFFSGLGKMNLFFSSYVQSGIAKLWPMHPTNSYPINLVLFHSGYILGIIELLLGIGLIFRRTKRIAAIFLIVMHGIIIVSFGPWLINYDAIILPWNMAFLLIIYILFIRKPEAGTDFSAIFKRWNVLFPVFFALLPILNFFGYWDYFLSSSLFSFRTPDMYVMIYHVGSAKTLEPYIVNSYVPDSGHHNYSFINVRHWAFAELGVPAYPELRIFKNIKSEMITRYSDMVADYIVYYYKDGHRMMMKLK